MLPTNIQKSQMSKHPNKRIKTASTELSKPLIQSVTKLSKHREQTEKLLTIKPIKHSTNIPFFLNVNKKNRKLIYARLTSKINLSTKFKPLRFKKKKIKKRLKRVLLVRGNTTRFIGIKKKSRKYKKSKKYKKIYLRNRKNYLKQSSIFNLSIKKNPYILIRKNYTALFTGFFKNRFITPLSFDYLHLAYFKLNKNTLYRPRALAKFDSYTKRMSKMTLKVFKYNRLSPYQYLFNLIKKKTHYQKIFDLFNTSHLYNLQLHQLYYFQKGNKYGFKLFIDCPDYINPNMAYLPFNQTDALKFHEYKYIQKIKGLYYPVTEILFKETHIHGLPMKTKLPRRV